MTKTGPNNGLRLELYTGDYEQIEYSYKSGFRVVVHNQSIEPILNKEGIDVAANVVTNVAVSRSFYEKFSTPYDECISVFDEQLAQKNDLFRTLYYDLNVKNIEKYTTDYCINTCNQLYLIKKCDCFDYENPKPKNISVEKGCVFVNITCWEKSDIEFFESEVNNCYKNCPIKCNTVKYDLSVSFADYPTAW
jgi:hypothetical protein